MSEHLPVFLRNCFCTGNKSARLNISFYPHESFVKAVSPLILKLIRHILISATIVKIITVNGTGQTINKMRCCQNLDHFLF